MNTLMKQKIVFLGDSSVGKTCIIGRFMTGDFSTGYEATIGTDFSTKTMTFQNKSIQLQIWDTAGQERYRSLIPSYIRDSSAAVIVYDINDRQSFENVDKWIEDVRSKEKGEIFLFLVGNKLDLGHREVTQKEALAKGQNYQCTCFETSAKTNINITELFNAITEKLSTLEPPVEEHIETVSIGNKKAENESNGGCC
ncbi:GTP-binding protein ryH1, putative [Entamoeba dispar SAW760]|uniref:GTP-binding protein ryH1, putative n=1 Tax=Entamoeba dispar (strain ATCC PRA-260 / SAW760) TaxID=370354 RepID=B0ELJ1_ENTDS|nr:GTP-binding protein ryH1, putative [Entamoeba dispar SAW760]EDR24605.1 GTP-binding protein ryH1, putative [Entamoeba dispar SAW760]|eukprot:EDR24605.1 GTP-binding protein ryH1, putative [Entamoeba dispar SAW760]